MIENVGRAAVLALAVAAASWWAMRYARGPAGLSMLWPGSGIVCGVMLVSARARWIWYLTGAFVAFAGVNALHNGLGGASVLLSLADVIEPTIVAWAVAGKVNDFADLSRVPSISVRASAATLAACALSAAVAVVALHGLPGFADTDRFAAWFASHVLGIVIFATLTVVAGLLGRNLFGVPGQRLAFFAELVLLAATCWLVFRTGLFPFPYIVFLPLLLVTFRRKFAGFALGTSLVAVFAMTAHASGYGPIANLAHFGEAWRALAMQVFVASTCLFTLPVAIVLTGRAALVKRLATSEREYRMLADYSRDLVIRFDANGMRRYISPSAHEMLGWSRDDLAMERWDLVHADDRPRLQQELAQLHARGGSTTVLYRVLRKDGRYVWIEANASLIPGADARFAPDVVYSGRDVTTRVIAEKALRNNERRLRAITANVPAIVLHVDKDERYTFCNAYAVRDLGLEESAMLGKHIAEVVDATDYLEIRPYVQAALGGRQVSFEIERVLRGHTRHYQSTYVPDVDEDGAVNGFYAVSFDITELKKAQRELLRLVRHDSLTGVANRLRFVERLELAVARSRRSHRPVALLYLDIDHFKQVNDTFGHAAGDAVLREFARRLSAHVRDVDLVARLGGDEFVIVLEQIESVADAQAIADKLLECMREPFALGQDANTTVSASVGIAFATHPVDDPETLLQKADAALYEAKRAGRNVWRMAG
ncbi:MAG: diguanylate cyclase [Proteobacteria bacterium]|nr:diguanylate cyclase [Pseudomonadota bacterium]